MSSPRPNRSGNPATLRSGPASAGPLRIGVVGAGGIAHAHLAAWQRLKYPVVVYSIDGRAEAVADRYGARAVGDLDTLLAECDIVDVCTPTPSHPEVVAAAAAAARHVICEKPLARTHVDAAGMIRTCAEAGMLLHPGQVVRYFPAYAAAHHAVRAGRIGTPAVLRLSRRGPAPVPRWFHDEAQSGGLLLDQMIHDFDYARWIAGEAESVYATIRPGPGDTVTADAIVRHAGGALSQISGGWTGPDEVFATEFSLAGSSGLLRHHSLATTAVTWSGVGDDRAGVVIPGGSAKSSPFDAELGEFAAAIAGGAAPRVTAEDSLAALDIALAALRSARTGRPVAVSEIAEVTA